MTKAQLERKIENHSQAIDRLEQRLNTTPTKYYRFACANCGNPFLLNEGQYSRRYDKGVTFTCSAGHGNMFTK